MAGGDVVLDLAAADLLVAVLALSLLGLPRFHSPSTRWASPAQPPVPGG